MTDQQLIKPMTNIIRLVPIVVFILVCFRLEAKPAELVLPIGALLLNGKPLKR